MNETLSTRGAMGAEAALIANPAVVMRSGLKSFYRVECLDWRGRRKWLEEVPNVTPDIGFDAVLTAAFMGASAGQGRRLPADWAVATAYSIGDYVKPATSPGDRYFVCQIAGTSHAATEPTWPSPSYSATVATTYTVADNTVTWQAADRWFIGLKDAGSVATSWTMASGLTEITPYSNATRPPFIHGSLIDSSTGRGLTNIAGDGGTVAQFTINATDTVDGAFLCDLGNSGTATGTLYSAADFGSIRNVESGDTLNVSLTIEYV